MRTNPLIESAFGKGRAFDQSEALTINGVCFRTFVLLTIAFLSGMWTWIHLAPHIAQVEVVKQAGHIARFMSVPGVVYGYLLGGCLSAFVVAIVTIGNPRIAFLTAPVYALLEGLCLGAISALYQHAYHGNLVAQAMVITFSVVGSMLLLYLFRIIKPTENFKSGVIAATFSVFVFYMLTILLGMFGVEMPFVYETGWMGILISLVIIGIAAANLILDFDAIDTGIKAGYDKGMGWYLGFGLMVTIVWLYLEIIDLLLKLQSDD